MDRHRLAVSSFMEDMRIRPWKASWMCMVSPSLGSLSALHWCTTGLLQDSLLLQKNTHLNAKLTIFVQKCNANRWSRQIWRSIFESVNGNESLQSFPLSYTLPHIRNEKISLHENQKLATMQKKKME